MAARIYVYFVTGDSSYSDVTIIIRTGALSVWGGDGSKRLGVEFQKALHLGIVPVTAVRSILMAAGGEA